MPPMFRYKLRTLLIVLAVGWTNAEAIMALDCLDNSRAWPHYWATSK
jgi:hypothetical protein